MQSSGRSCPRPTAQRKGYFNAPGKKQSAGRPREPEAENTDVWFPETKNYKNNKIKIEKKKNKSQGGRVTPPPS